MSESNKTYTYRGGKKVELEKSPDQIVVRALPDHVDDAAVVSSEQVSSASMRINVSNENSQALMERRRCVRRTQQTI